MWCSSALNILLLIVLNKLLFSYYALIVCCIFIQVQRNKGAKLY